MSLGPSEVIVGSGPKNTNGVRNQFLEVHIAMLRDANIPARIATLSDVGPEHKPRWAEEHGDWEPLFIVVPEDRRKEALQVNQTIEAVRRCVQCDAYIKPEATKCPKCGVADRREPAQLRIEYATLLQKHFESK